MTKSCTEKSDAIAPRCRALSHDSPMIKSFASCLWIMWRLVLFQHNFLSGRVTCVNSTSQISARYCIPSPKLNEDWKQFQHIKFSSIILSANKGLMNIDKIAVWFQTLLITANLMNKQHRYEHRLCMYTWQMIDMHHTTTHLLISLSLLL